MGQRGRFITFEGGEGVGKSTQIHALAEWLSARGIISVVTREPGGSKGAETIRELLVTGEPGRWDAVTEALLMNAARRDHVVRTIRPALDAGVWVLCDRFHDSTIVYQGHAGGVPIGTLRALIDAAVEDTRPDLTAILDLDSATGLSRAEDRQDDEGRFERKGAAFHTAVANGFRMIAASEPERCALINASGSVEEVTARIAEVVRARLPVIP